MSSTCSAVTSVSAYRARGIPVPCRARLPVRRSDGEFSGSDHEAITMMNIAHLRYPQIALVFVSNLNDKIIHIAILSRLYQGLHLALPQVGTDFEYGSVMEV